MIEILEIFERMNCKVYMIGVKGLINLFNMRDCELGNLFDIMVILMYYVNCRKSIYLFDVGISIVFF